MDCQVRFPLFFSEHFPDSLFHTDTLDNLKNLLVLSSNSEENSVVYAKAFGVSPTVSGSPTPAVFKGSRVPLGEQ